MLRVALSSSQSSQPLRFTELMLVRWFRSSGWILDVKFSNVERYGISASSILQQCIDWGEWGWEAKLWRSPDREDITPKGTPELNSLSYDTDRKICSWKFKSKDVQCITGSCKARVCRCWTKVLVAARSDTLSQFHGDQLSCIVLFIAAGWLLLLAQSGCMQVWLNKLLRESDSDLWLIDQMTNYC